MKNKVIIYSPFVLWSPHFETDLEIIEKHLQNGDTVSILNCSGQLPTCATNPYHKNIICSMCRSRFKKGIKWIGTNRVNVVEIYNVNDIQRQQIDGYSKMRFDSIDQIRNINIDDADIGMSAISSTVSQLREPRLDLNKHEKLIRTHLVSASIVYYSIYNHLKRDKPDLVVIFNGRYAQVRPALRVCQKMDIKTYVHERAGVLDRYSMTLNTYPHNINAIKHEIEEIYRKSELTDMQKQELAYEWYEERRNNKQQNWYSFTSRQKQNMLPEIDKVKTNLVIFNTSEEEFVATEEWLNPFYKDQNEGIVKILKSLQNNKRIKIYLRIHPNLANLNISQNEELTQISREYPELTVIPADSEISTYSLIDACDVVLTFGSTVGIEAVYRNKPSILMGRAFYEDLGGCIKPSSHDELIELLNSIDDVNSVNRIGAKTKQIAVIKYGLFNKLWGQKFLYAKPYDVENTSMAKDGKQVFIKPSIFLRLINKINSSILLSNQIG